MPIQISAAADEGDNRGRARNGNAETPRIERQHHPIQFFTAL
jgi:hypothetical protein